ncbi:uncharacterized protein LOC122628433 isoform X3 [Vespula pensylvanica]|uniref:uncharacterized protein LOC122628433 isoform X3 n=2 Tax=Vespula TaxID=7451 RepID=UPI001CBA3D62|nr:uncharacterized protein LOC122628433 isoform X3 [Vespula pensylvanica]
MTEKSKTKSRVYLAGKESTVKAVELLQSRLNNRKRSWDNKDNDKSHKMTHRCTSMPLQKKSDYVSLTGFSKSLLMLEVRSHLDLWNKHIRGLIFQYKSIAVSLCDLNKEGRNKTKKNFIKEKILHHFITINVQVIE